MKLHRWIAILCCAGSAISGAAQEVRRAQPIAPTPTPATAPRALPVDPSRVPGLEPEAPPLQTDKPQQPAQNSILTPARPRESAPDGQSSTGSAAEPEPAARRQLAEDEIRLAPSQATDPALPPNPAKAQLAVADGLYARKMYDLAIPEYEKYLGQFPGDSSRAAALYRLADAYAMIGQEAPAQTTFRLLISQVGSGEFVGSAAFRLASREFDQKNFDDALPLYEKAYSNARSPEVKLTARYYMGKCFELSNRKAEARKAYEDVLTVKDKNPYRDAARLSVAYYALENNQKQQAFDSFNQLGQEAVKPAVRAEGLTRAGMLAADLGKRDQADALLRAAVALNAPGKWKQIAQLEQMKLQYDGDKFAQVLDSYAKTANALGDETRPSVLLLVANSYRQLGKHQKALEIYGQLMSQYPNTAESYDARYQRLVSLDATKNPTLVPEVDSYLATSPSRERTDKAKLLKAQALVQQSRFDLAAKLYLELSGSTLPDVYQADCYYAAGYCMTQIGNSQGAIQAFSGLIDKFPKHKMAAKALMKRALLQQEARNFPAAVADFDRIVKDYPLSQEREMALLQKGLTLGQIENYQPMIATFRQLLKDYPNSSGAPQANYWIGWAAFESKKYEEAIAPLQKARELNPDEFGERTSIRLIVAYQNLNQKENAAQEIDRFVAADPKQASLVADICRWLGVSYFDERNFTGAVKYLELLTKNVEREKFDKGIWLIFGRALTEVQRYPDAATAFNTYLELATEPTDRSQGFLALAKSQLRAKEFDPATKSAEQALALQPEGKLNAEARILLGDVEFGRGNFENAAKSYLAVAVLYEDPEVTPRALEHAYRAFREAGNLPQADKTMSELKQRFPNYPVSQTRSTAG